MTHGIELTVTKRSNDWHVCLADDPGFWGCGKSREEALQDWQLTHGETYGTVLPDQTTVVLPLNHIKE